MNYHAENFLKIISQEMHKKTTPIFCIYYVEGKQFFPHKILNF